MIAQTYNYWGKASEDSYHLLVYHCLDVAAVGKVWLEQSPTFVKRAAKASGLTEQAFTEWFLFFLALHDLGKFDIRFQGKVVDVLKKLQPETRLKPVICVGYNHGEAGWAWGIKEQIDYFGESNDAFTNWLKVVAGHHGVIPQKSTMEPPTRRSVEPYEIIVHDQNARIEFVKAMHALLAPNQSIETLPDNPSPLLAGFCSVCDWIGSNSDYFVLNTSYDTTKSTYDNCECYYQAKFESARKALDDFGVISTIAAVGGMEVLFCDYAPQGVQTIINQIPIGQSLTIIEAPTGSGKTETALAYASLLLTQNIVDTVTFALPTQATTNAMFSRIEQVATKMFEGEANIILAHGKSGFNESFLNIKNKTRTPKEEDCFVQCSNWLASSKKRTFLGQIGVCTIDQVLLSVLPVKHYFVRSFGIGRSVLIVDEVHAYDNYMYGLLEEVIREQKRLGGSVVLLSATLPFNQKEKLLNAWGIKVSRKVEPKDMHYPLIYSSLLDVPISVEKDDLPKPFTVSIDLVYSEKLVFTDTLIAKIITAAESGASVCVICNIVSDAQELAQKISESISSEIPVDIFHSRYRFKDRQVKESTVVEKYGKTGERRGRILVATQVVEQSLDIDFDWMVTQICPADLLFQRLGRLHRHNHVRPLGFEDRKITVVLPVDAYEYGGTGVVYANILALWKTQKLLEGNATIEFPKVYREWIEDVYDADESDAPEELKEKYNSYLIDNEARHALANHLTRNRDAINAIDDRSDDATSLTRDGEMSISLIPMLDSDTLLDGTRLSKLQEWQKWEALSLNSIPVSSSKSWKYNFTPFEDGYMKIEMHETNGLFVMENEKYRFNYTVERGLERIEL